MKALEEYNPIALAVFFFAAAGVTMFCMNPVILVLSLAGSVLLYVLRNRSRGLSFHLFCLLLFAGATLINPLFHHNGVTVLLVINDNPVTLEALLYGMASAAMIVSVLYWFRSFSQIMTSDKQLYLFGSVSPKTALILSMVLRYIPLFRQQTRRVNQTQKALGLYREDNAIDSIRGGARVFSVMVTWALENGIITADSMTARGYGIGRRTFFSRYRFRKADALLLTATAALLILTVWGIASGKLDFEYYPAIRAAGSPLSRVSLAAWGLLVFLPSLLVIGEEAAWKFLRSAI